MLGLRVQLIRTRARVCFEPQYIRAFAGTGQPPTERMEGKLSVRVRTPHTRYPFNAVLLCGVSCLALVVGCGEKGQGDGAEQGLVVSGAWIRAVGSPSGVPTAGYLSIRNEGPFLEVLDSVRADVAERVELHRTDLEGDVMRMRRVGSVDVPSGQVVKLAPGGLHLMLMDLTRPLRVGQTVTMELHFRRAGTVTVDAVVRTGME